MTTNLPDDCQRLLDLARDGHDPVDPDARVRVRHALAASLALSAGAAGSVGLPGVHGAAHNTQLPSGAAHGTAAGKAGFTVFGSKLVALAAATVAAAGIGLAVYGARQPAAPVQLPKPSDVAPLSAPSLEPLVVPSSAASDTPTSAALVQQEQAAPVELVPSVAHATTTRSDPARKTVWSTHGGDTLTAETALLRTATEALTRGDEPAALASLLQHAKQYPRGSLREERDGLRAIAECSQDTTPSSVSAKRFARTFPNSMLGARVAKACEGK